MNIIDLDKKDLFILGDFNINFLEKSDLSTKKLDRIIAQLGLAKTISTPTHFGNVTNSCIEQIFTNANHIWDSGVDDVNLSEHQLIYVIKKKGKFYVRKQTLWEDPTEIMM